VDGVSQSAGLWRGVGPTTPSERVAIRPMTTTDVAAAIALTWEAFGIPADTVGLLPTWEARVQMMLRTDPAGAFVAVDRGGEVIGVAAALARGGLWVLSLLAVRPRVQSRGAGRALMEAALSYRSDLEHRLLMSTNDPRAMRLYWQAGFALHPAMLATGRLRRERLPPSDPRITEVASSEIPQLAPISVAVRGGAHTEEMRMMAGTGARIYRLADRGFVVVSVSREVWLLAALDTDSAEALLWCGLARASQDGPVRVRYVSGANQWAIDILMAAGLDLIADGAVAVVGNPGPLCPFIPSGPLS
jgi:ribosomal protein S18 acetylase RimI-like enzyme